MLIDLFQAFKSDLVQRKQMKNPLSVSELNIQIKHILEETFLSVYVEGEISNLTLHTSGHIYFSLKDEQSSISCVMFRSNAQNIDIELKEGSKIEVIGELSLYLPRGNYQILCKKILSSKVGDLSLAYEKLKKDLQAQGYFEHKKPLPLFPKKIALLTSSTGAVIHDMLKTAEKRWKLAKFLILETLVQGKGAKEYIAHNIAYADKLGVDVIVLARGGGSTEDLWAFNEKIVADAIFKAQTPIISAIGHQSDFLISDLVADHRSPTPTGAMELLLPDQSYWLYSLDEMQENLNQILQKNLSQKTLFIQSLREQSQILNPNYKLQTQQKECNQIKQAMHLRIENLLTHKANTLDHSYKNFTIINLFASFIYTIQSLKQAYELSKPKHKKGYAQITKNNQIITLSKLKDGDLFELTDSQTSILAQKLPKN